MREKGWLPFRLEPGTGTVTIAFHSRGATGGNGAWDWGAWTEHSTLEAVGRLGMSLK